MATNTDPTMDDHASDASSDTSADVLPDDAGSVLLHRAEGWSGKDMTELEGMISDIVQLWLEDDYDMVEECIYAILEKDADIPAFQCARLWYWLGVTPVAKGDMCRTIDSLDLALGLMQTAFDAVDSSGEKVDERIKWWKQQVSKTRTNYLNELASRTANSVTKPAESSTAQPIRLPVRKNTSTMNELGVSKENLQASFRQPKKERRAAIWQLLNGASDDEDSSSGSREGESAAEATEAVDEAEVE